MLLLLSSFLALFEPVPENRYESFGFDVERVDQDVVGALVASRAGAA
jgi:hypothetical protein